MPRDHVLSKPARLFLLSLEGFKAIPYLRNIHTNNNLKSPALIDQPQGTGSLKIGLSGNQTLIINRDPQPGGAVVNATNICWPAQQG